MIFVSLGRFLRRSLNSSSQTQNIFHLAQLQYWDVTANQTLVCCFAVAEGFVDSTNHFGR